MANSCGLRWMKCFKTSCYRENNKLRGGNRSQPNARVLHCWFLNYVFCYYFLNKSTYQQALFLTCLIKSMGLLKCLCSLWFHWEHFSQGWLISAGQPFPSVTGKRCHHRVWNARNSLSMTHLFPFLFFPRRLSSGPDFDSPKSTRWLAARRKQGVQDHKNNRYPTLRRWTTGSGIRGEKQFQDYL